MLLSKNVIPIFPNSQKDRNFNTNFTNESELNKNEIFNKKFVLIRAKFGLTRFTGVIRG